jgi:ADP-heptose:LPS heptosyltransferase
MLLSVGTALMQARVLRVLKRPRPQSRKSILVIRLDQTLGDSAMNSPLLRELRVAYPDAEISLVVHPRIYEMTRYCPHIDAIYQYDWGKSLARSLVKRNWLAMSFCWKTFGAKQFDLAVVPRFDEDHHAGLIALFSGASRRIGYTERVSERKSVLNFGFDRFYTDVLPGSGVKHEVERNLEILRYLGAEPRSSEMEFWRDPADGDFAREVLESNQVQPGVGILVGLGLSGGHSALKRWPVAHYIELAQLIVDANPDKRVRFLLVGGKEDIPLGKAFSEAHPDTIDMIGRTTILQMGALLASTDYFIGNDSGAMHVAAASGTKVIGIFGSSCHHRFSAWGNRAKSISLELDCGPCKTNHVIDRCSACVYPSPKCMDDLAPQRVLELVA